MLKFSAVKLSERKGGTIVGIPPHPAMSIEAAMPPVMAAILSDRVVNALLLSASAQPNAESALLDPRINGQS
jgi:hypothetical protein